MVTISSSLTVFFEEPFWVGVYERQSGNRLEVCKITFGAEPKDYEVYDFLLRNDHRCGSALLSLRRRRAGSRTRSGCSAPLKSSFKAKGWAPRPSRLSKPSMNSKRSCTKAEAAKKKNARSLSVLSKSS